MAAQTGFRPPFGCVGLFRLIGLIVPCEERERWVRRYGGNLASLWILSGRGDLPGHPFPYALSVYSEALSSAVAIRCAGFDPGRCLRSSSFVIAAAAAVLLIIGALTNGFTQTQALINAAGNLTDRSNQNRLVAYLFPIAFAFSTSVMMAAGQVSLRGRNWRYAAYFLSKTVLVQSIVLALWVEGGAAIRASISNQGLRVLVGGVLLAIAFIGLFSRAALWCVADQNHRCSICLRRLVAPVRVGSWASVFDPPAIEWVCEDGHGALCEQECETGSANRWFSMEPVTVKVFPGL